MAGFDDENTPLLGVTEDSYMMRSIEETGEFQAIHIPEGSIDSYSIGEELLFDTPGLLASEKKGGCVMCRTEKPIATFSELRPGDQIAIRGQLCCLGLCYDHHAIVTRVQTREGDNPTADITVVDVDEKRMTCGGCTCTRRARCCWWFSCCKCMYPIREHKLSDKTWQITSQCSSDHDVSTQQIRRIDYKKRRNDNTTTTNVARQFCQLADDRGPEYCFFFQNCEHCASACVNGPKTAKHETLKKTLSLQSYSCFWNIVHVLFWLLLACFYALEFYIFATFNTTEPNIAFPISLNKTIIQVCNIPKKCTTHFNPNDSIIDEYYNHEDCSFFTCNLIFVGISSSVLTLIFVTGLFLFYQPLYHAGFICRMCLITARMDCFSKILAFFLTEVVGFVKQPLYAGIILFRRESEIIGNTVFIAFIGAMLIFSISSVISWVLGMCYIPSCRGVIQYTKFFKFRGLAYLIVCTIRKVRKCFVKLRRRHGTGLIN